MSEKIKQLVNYFEALIPGYQRPDESDLYVGEDYSLFDWLQEVIVNDEVSVYVEKYQYDAFEFNELSPLKIAGVTISDDELYDEDDELIDVDEDPFDLFTDHFNQQLEKYDLKIVDLWNQEYSTYVCISTKDEEKVDEFYRFLNETDFFSE